PAPAAERASGQDHAGGQRDRGEASQRLQCPPPPPRPWSVVSNRSPTLPGSDWPPVIPPNPDGAGMGRGSSPPPWPRDPRPDPPGIPGTPAPLGSLTSSR